MPRRILGIDPGSRITGVAVIEKAKTGTPICLFGGCIRLTATSEAARLGALFVEIQQIVETYQPTELAIEQVFVHKNVRSALKLGQARGVAIAAIMQADLTVFEYAPRLIKKAITGNGSADKAQVQHMVQALLGLPVKPQADAADALAVALCHLHTDMAVSNVSPQGKRRYKRTAVWKSYDRTTSR
ncbi:MAG: crossover junction endodeoxyribonuclease RuvC [Candidatus Berkiella sp.]